MTNQPSDPIDPYERVVARRVGTYADQAVEPIDAGEIARNVARGNARGRARAGRGLPSLGWALLAGVVVVAVSAAVIGFRSRGGVGAPATPTAAPVTVRSCQPDDVDAVITSWDGAAGSRIATVVVHQVGSSSCTIDPLPKPWLADGHGGALITGKAGARTPITIAPGDVVSTLVEVSNYCGPAPVAPVTVAFTQGEAVFVATAVKPTDTSGVPPCNGPGAGGSIQMQPFKAGPPS